MKSTITMRLPEELDQWLEEQAKLTGFSKAKVIREHLELSRSRKLRQKFLDLAGTMEGLPDLSTKRGFQL